MWTGPLKTAPANSPDNELWFLFWENNPIRISFECVCNTVSVLVTALLTHELGAVTEAGRAGAVVAGGASEIKRQCERFSKDLLMLDDAPVRMLHIHFCWSKLAVWLFSNDWTDLWPLSCATKFWCTPLWSKLEIIVRRTEWLVNLPSIFAFWLIFFTMLDSLSWPSGCALYQTFGWAGMSL